MIFRCPVCKDWHTIPEYESKNDYVCVRGKTFQDMTPTDILSRNNLMNRSSIKVDENRSATIIVENTVKNRTIPGLKIGQGVGKNY